MYTPPFTISAKADSGPFIDFMLGEILEALKEHQGEERLPNKVLEQIPGSDGG